MNNVRQQIMEVIIRSPGSSIEEVVLECHGLTWSQVFIELDRMSRCTRGSMTAVNFSEIARPAVPASRKPAVLPEVNEPSRELGKQSTERGAPSDGKMPCHAGFATQDRKARASASWKATA